MLFFNLVGHGRFTSRSRLAARRTVPGSFETQSFATVGRHPGSNFFRLSLRQPFSPSVLQHSKSRAGLVEMILRDLDLGDESHLIVTAIPVEATLPPAQLFLCHAHALSRLRGFEIVQHELLMDRDAIRSRRSLGACRIDLPQGLTSLAYSARRSPGPVHQGNVDAYTAIGVELLLRAAESNLCSFQFTLPLKGCSKEREAAGAAGRCI
jgi:hypothetical protein